ncbi:MAG: hypothetical protein GY856_27485, partial [bacterium]|nr:hypothetical protein [bacterium]
APKAEEILDGYVEATGGEAAYAKLTNRVGKATIELAAQGITFSTTIYHARPNKLYSVAEAEAFGKIESGTDGDVVWEINLMTGPQIKEGEERAFLLRSSALDSVVNWREYFKEVEYAGQETIDERPCHKIVLTPEEGKPETRYYDQESHLLVKIEMTLQLPMGPIPMEVYSSDYRAVDGILMAHRARVLTMGMERIVTTESIEHNVELPADLFDLPGEIQALLAEEESPAG